MKKIMLGCQTITWGDEQTRNFAAVFREIKAAGFEGVEIGWRRLVAMPASGLKRLLQKSGLKLIGIHMGGNLKDDKQAQGEWSALDAVLKYVTELGAERIMFSGTKYTGDEQLKTDLGILTEAGRRCRSQGIEFLYHNHDWEFKKGRKIFDGLLASPLKFCPDLGWIYKAGEKIPPVLEQIKGRIGAVHFKDFKNQSRKKEDWLNPVILGTGKAPLSDAAKWLLKNATAPIWWIAEQDFADISPGEAAIRNAEFLRSNLKGRRG